MRFCRLCGEYKTVEELVVSMDDPIRILKFRDFVEYYCQIVLDVSPKLEQRACKSCKAALDRFAEFSCKVELHQKKLQKLPEIIVVKIEDDGPSEQSDEVQMIESEPEPLFEVVECNPGNEIKFENEDQENSKKEDQEPAPKKSKTNEVEQKELLEAVPSVDHSDEVINISDNEESLPLRRSRRKSVHEKAQLAKEKEKLAQEKEPADKPALPKRRKSVHHKERVCATFGEVLERTESLFESVNISRCEQIEIPKAKLKKDGEVPRSWLSGFENFKTWDEFTYVCQDHCKMKFEGFLAYCLHQNQFSVTKRSVQCLHCNQNFKGASSDSSYINHVSTKHFHHLKFCCVVCSRVFFNMLSLLQHCKAEHKDIKLLDLYPCLECGAYKCSFSNLKIHKAIHDK